MADVTMLQRDTTQLATGDRTLSFKRPSPLILHDYNSDFSTSTEEIPRTHPWSPLLRDIHKPKSPKSILAEAPSAKEIIESISKAAIVADPRSPSFARSLALALEVDVSFQKIYNAAVSSPLARSPHGPRSPLSPMSPPWLRPLHLSFSTMQSTHHHRLAYTSTCISVSPPISPVFTKGKEGFVYLFGLGSHLGASNDVKKEEGAKTAGQAHNA